MFRQPVYHQRFQWRAFSENISRSQRIQAPTFFKDPNAAPLPYNSPQPSSGGNSPRQGHEESSGSSTEEKRPFREFANLLATASLAYLALDNYQGRVKAEKLNQETIAINLKTLKLQQQNYIKGIKQQDIKTLKERIEVSKRCFKMSMHIAILKKQLQDLHVDPKNITEVSEEFDKHVKISNSAQNLTGTAIWLDDSSDYKGLMPDYRDYDRKT